VQTSALPDAFSGARLLAKPGYQKRLFCFTTAFFAMLGYHLISAFIAAEGEKCRVQKLSRIRTDFVEVFDASGEQ
jgi:hypothetical protein